ncbi:MAG: nucleotidyltransferase domain-containing protein, partial [Nanoarchaeota archaeon]
MLSLQDDKLRGLVETVLPRIQPNQEAQSAAHARVSRMIESIRVRLSESGVEADVVLGGSLAKNTNLAGDFDADVFVRFSDPYPDEQLSDILEQALDPMQFMRVHGSRDYFQKEEDGIAYEIVPVRAISSPEEATNVTDCSYLHVLWVQGQEIAKKVEGLPLHDHIRLAKAFCKSIRVYGAESYIGGISGHVLDILVLHYGGLLQCMREVASWKECQVVDPEEQYATTEAAYLALDPAKRSCPLVVIDPVDPTRNAAAALEQATYDRLRESCAHFLSSPSASWFTAPQLSPESWHPPEEEVYAVAMTALEGKKDVVGAKMRKAAEYVVRRLEEAAFVVYAHEFWWDGQGTAVLLLHIPQGSIP